MPTSHGRLQDRIAVVTGGARGVGAEIARLFVAEGARVVLSGRDEANEVRATADGGCIVAGFTSSFGAGGDDGWILKLAADGTIEWEKTYGGTDNDQFTAIALSPNGFYVGGTIDDAVTGLDDEVLVPTVPTGNKHLALVVGVDQSNQVTKHNSVFVSQSRPRQ